MEYITFLTEMSLLGFAQTPCNEAAKFVSWNRRKEICFVFCVDLSMNERIYFVWLTFVNRNES